MQGLLKTGKANSPSVSTTWLAISLAVFVSLYVALLVLDIWPDAALRAPATRGRRPSEEHVGVRAPAIGY